MNLEEVEEQVDKDQTQPSLPGSTIKSFYNSKCVVDQESGYFYFFGGYFNNALSNTLYKSDIHCNMTQLASLDLPPPARYSHSICLYNNSIFVYGGYDSKNTLLNDLWCYSIAENRWTRKFEMNNYPGLAGHSCVVLDDTLYLIGSKPKGGVMDSVLSLHSINLHTGAYSFLSMDLSNHNPKPCPRSECSCFLYNKQIIVVGGISHIGDSLMDMWSLDRSTNKWEILDEGKTECHFSPGASISMIHSCLYCYGGLDPIYSIYDLKSTEWRVYPILTGESILLHTSCLLENDQEVTLFNIGGYSFTLPSSLSIDVQFCSRPNLISPVVLSHEQTTCKPLSGPFGLDSDETRKWCEVQRRSLGNQRKKPLSISVELDETEWEESGPSATSSSNLVPSLINQDESFSKVSSRRHVFPKPINTTAFNNQDSSMKPGDNELFTPKKSPEVIISSPIYPYSHIPSPETITESPNQRKPIHKPAKSDITWSLNQKRGLNSIEKFLPRSLIPKPTLPWELPSTPLMQHFTPSPPSPYTPNEGFRMNEVTSPIDTGDEPYFTTSTYTFEEYQRLVRDIEKEREEIEEIKKNIQNLELRIPGIQVTIDKYKREINSTKQLLNQSKYKKMEKEELTKKLNDLLTVFNTI